MKVPDEYFSRPEPSSSSSVGSSSESTSKSDLSSSSDFLELSSIVHGISKPDENSALK